MISILPVTGMPEVRAGDDLGALIAASIAACGAGLQDGDVVVVTSKIVSKSFGLYADPAARPDLVLQESSAVVSERATPDSVTRVVVAAAGPVLAGAGIDASNAADERLLLLPRDPDRAANDVRVALSRAWGDPAPRCGVLLSDTSGRPWRAGVTDFALGLSQVVPWDDLRGLPDTHGRDLAVTLRNIADEIAAAADLVKGKLDRVPVAIVRGLADRVQPDAQGAAALVRTGPSDWFGLGRAEAVRAALGVPPGTARSRAVGIEATHPEPLRERVDRAVRVALSAGDQVLVERLEHPEAAENPETTVVIRLSAEDPVMLGRVWARVEVALAGERLACIATDRAGPTGVRLTIGQPDGSLAGAPPTPAPVDHWGARPT